MLTSYGEEDIDPPDREDRPVTGLDLTTGGGVSGTSRTPSATTTQPFSDNFSAGVGQPPALSQAAVQPTATSDKEGPLFLEKLKRKLKARSSQLNQN